MGKNLLAARTALGLTINDVAERTGLSSTHICDLEHDARTPSDEALALLCSALGVDLEDARARIGRVPKDIADRLVDPTARGLVRAVLGIRK